MTRGEAITRINDGLGFKASGNSLEATIVKRLQEAQRDLEKGKTLPKWLILEDQTLTLLQGEHDIDLPDTFLRLDDDNLPHYTNLDSFLPTYLDHVRSYSDAVQRIITLQRPGEPAMTVLAPRLFVIRKTKIDFISTADRDYDLAWNYYHAAMVLDSDDENLWLANAPEWLIGEAGYRIAMDSRNDSATKLFDDMRTRARAAEFGELLADEDSGGPLVMGATL
jgi:hypothetical protein